MESWSPGWLHPGARSSRRRSRPGPRPRPRPRHCRLQVEELENRITPSSGGVGLNLPITTDADVQQMPSIAVDPLDSQHIVISYMDRSLVQTGYAGIGVAVSHDGGDTWEQTALPLPAGFDQGAAQPTVRFDGQGHLFVSFQATTFLGPLARLTSPTGIRFDLGGLPERALGLLSNNGMFVARSDDGGLTWGQPVAVVSHLYDGVNPVPFELYPDLAIDTFRNLPDGRPNPNYGNLYEVWARYYPAGQFPGEPTAPGGSEVFIAVSRDGGQTWQTRVQNLAGIDVPVTVIQNPQNGGGAPAGLGFTTFAHPSVGPDGDVYVGLWEGGDFAVQHSTDAGVSFQGPDFNSTDRLAFGLDAAVTNNAGLPGDHFRTLVVRQIAADPARPGNVYVVENFRVTDAAGNPVDAADVFFARSTDYGVTWQRTEMVGGRSALVLNDDNDGQSASGQDPTEEIHGQAHAHLAVDGDGNIGVIWYDTRRDPGNRLIDVFGTVSTDGGLTFSANFRVTDASFDPDFGSFIDPAGQPDFYLGDTTGLALANGSAYATWTDTRNSNQDVYVRRFSIAPPPVALNDRFEPNDTPAAATDLGQQLKLLVSKLALPAGDEDWFRVQATATGNFTVMATGPTPGMGLAVELWDASGTTRLATGSDLLDADGQVIGQQATFTGLAGQSYVIHVVAVGGGAARYSLQIVSLTADLGTIVHNVQANTFQPGDQDYFLLSAAAAGSLEVKLNAGAGANGNFQLELLDPNTLEVLSTGTSGSGLDFVASLAVEQGQAVLVHLSGAVATQGNFTLELTNLDQFSAAQGTSLVFPAGDGPSKIAAGDLNGDGVPDLVVSNFLANTVSILLANGDGTFQSPRQFAIGAVKTTFVPGLDTQVLNFRQRRDVRLADFNGDHVLDIVVTNYDSGDISVLLGRGDGTFQTQRRFNATPNPLGLDIGDVNNDGKLDIVAIDSTPADVPNNLTILLGRGDGTFEPELQPFILIPRVLFLANVRLADFNNDGKLDLAVGGGQQFGIDIYLGNGDGTFTYEGPVDGSRQGADMVAVDFNHDGNIDLAIANFSELTGATVLLGNGDGSFQPPQDFFSGQGPDALRVADFGSVINGSTALGPPDGNPDLIVANTGQLTGTTVSIGGPGIVVLPSLYDSNGFMGFGDPYLVAPAKGPFGLDTGDFNGDGMTDIAVADQNGARVVFNRPPVISSGDTPQTARNLGTVVHLLEPTLTIVPGHEDAYFRLRAPTEVARGAGDEVLDFSALFEHTEGAGLQMEVRDAAGNLLGSGPRFRVTAAQGAELTVHIFGVQGNGSRGTGAYTLDINVLPQLVSIESQSLLPGQGLNPGGPTASIVLTFQGDRLDPASAENPANYRITWLGEDGQVGTPDDRVVAIQAGTGDRSVVYDPSTNINVASGNVYPTAIRQTVTLLFTEPLPAGSYLIELSPAIQTAAFNDAEQSLLSPSAGLNSHPVVSLAGAQVVEGARRTAPGLVLAASALGDFGVYETGTPFLTQLHDDLSALLDAELRRLGDQPTVSTTIDNQIMDRFDPALGPADQRPVAMLVIWLDPVSPTLVVDSQGSRVVYDQRNGSFTNTVSRAYVNVTGNLEVIVVPIFATRTETFRLGVADVPATARGGVLYFGVDGNQTRSLTADLRAGVAEFVFTYGSTLALIPPQTFTEVSRPTPTPTPPLPVPQVNVDSGDSNRAAFIALSTRSESAPVTAIGPVIQVNGNAGAEVALALTATRRGTAEMADGGGSASQAAEAFRAATDQFFAEFDVSLRSMQDLAEQFLTWLRMLENQAPANGGGPGPMRPGGAERPDRPMPDEESEPSPFLESHPASDLPGVSPITATVEDEPGVPRPTSMASDESTPELNPLLVGILAVSGLLGSSGRKRRSGRPLPRSAQIDWLFGSKGTAHV